MPTTNENFYLLVEYSGTDYLPREERFDSCDAALKFIKSLPARSTQLMKVKTRTNSFSILPI